MSIANPRIVALFDVDGTLTVPRGEITEDMMAFLKELSTKVTVGIVGGTHAAGRIAVVARSTSRGFPL